MRRLSKSIGDLKLHYEVVVVGSGYGGGIAASRLARCGRSVCVLERGKEYLIGDFPDRFSEARSEFQLTHNDTHMGSRLGLYDLRIHDDINVFVGCGLGGTSLINANVSLAPDPRVWEDDVWPEELIADEDRDEGFARAERMLRPVPYPNEKNLDKIRAFRISGAALNKECKLPPINVTFKKQVNRAGVMQPACTLCGDCCGGCNVGSKNTVQMTYLPDAVNYGAEIYTECSVQSLRKEHGKWSVFFELVGRDREKFGSPEQSISADLVILCAGTLGSTEILLRSKEVQGLRLSDQLGQKFSGNGDVMAFAYNNDIPINGIGFGHPPQIDIPAVGPSIAGLIDLRDTDRLEDGMVIEEGAIPSSLAPVLPALFSAGSAVFGQDTDFDLNDEVREKSRTIQSILLGSYRGAIHHTQTFLVMSYDDGRGRMRLNDAGKIQVDWPGVAQQPSFQNVNANLEIAAKANGGTYIRNPISNTIFGENMITVHPLGGCVIGKDRTSGVVNHKCQVFDGGADEKTTAVHQGLYVCDGSIIPRPLGVNPLLTISGLSERAMIHLARDYNWQFDDKPKVDAPTRLAGILQAKENQAAGVEFTERMVGYISDADVGDYDAAAQYGKRDNNEFSFTATIVIGDVVKFIEDPDHTGTIVGLAYCSALSNDPLEISNGIFNLMRVDEDEVETRQFDYRMILGARDGKEYYFAGHKIVRADRGPDMWEDTTKLFVDLFGGRDGQHGIIAKGILNISILDFATQLNTIKGINGRNSLDRMQAVARFGHLFARSLYSIYGGVFVPTDRYDEKSVRKKRELNVNVAEVYSFKTPDGLTLRLTRYKGGEKGPVIFSHGLGVSSKIFSIDTIETNLLEFISAAGYDCWLLDYRASTDLNYCRSPWTADDVALNDYQPAIDRVREITGRSSVQMVVHCFGSTTFFMAMLLGLQGVRSAVASQIATDVVVPGFPQRTLAYLRMPGLFSALGIKSVNARAEKYDKLWERTLDKGIQLLVPFQWEERTRNATSNRITALYGQLYELDQLNPLTLQSGVPEMFGPANIRAFQHLALIARRKTIVGANGDNRYLENIGNLAIPICFIHGAENACFKPQSTELTLERLIAAHGPELYERHVIPGYGHIDCIFGKDADTDVYPLILRHLEKFATA